MNNNAYAGAFEKFIAVVNNVYNVDKYKPTSFTKFSRFYWNVDQIKKIYENIPGYVERYLDEKLRVKVDYLDNGVQNFENRDRRIKMFSKDEKLFNILKKEVSNIQKELQEEKEDKANTITTIVEKYVRIKELIVYIELIEMAYQMNLNSKYGTVLNKAEI